MWHVCEYALRVLLFRAKRNRRIGRFILRWKIILTCIMKEKDGRQGTGFISLRMEISGCTF
jgi:hypothetical protein